MSNEISGDLSLIDGATLKVEATVPLGKRPRGIEATADGKSLFVALSGSPIAGPPPPGGVRDKDDDDDDDPPADKSADGIGHFDIASRKLVRIVRGVSDPEKLSVTPDARRIVVASEDTGTAIVLDAVSGKVLASAPVGEEPEGVRVSPDGRQAWMTSESAQQVSIIDLSTHKVVKQVKVGKRPRSIAFTPDGAKAYVPGEFDGTVTVFDARKLTVTGVIHLDGKDVRPMDAVVSPDGRSLYVSTGRGRTVAHIDTRIDKVLRTVTVGARPWRSRREPGRQTHFLRERTFERCVRDRCGFLQGDRNDRRGEEAPGVWPSRGRRRASAGSDPQFEAPLHSDSGKTGVPAAATVGCNTQMYERQASQVTSADSSSPPLSKVRSS